MIEVTEKTIDIEAVLRSKMGEKVIMTCKYK